MASKQIYRVRFLNQDKVYEVYAGRVYQGDMFGFIVIEDLRFGERSGVVVDPSEERLAEEFRGVRQTYIPMHACIRIDAVEKEGPARITPVSDKVSPFPSPIYTPRGGKDPG